MASHTYRLPDEPLPSGLANYAVDPIWPLLAFMLAGNGVGLAWFVFNAIAMGSPTRGRELAYVATSLLGSALLLLLLGMGKSNHWLEGSQLRYAGLSIVVLKIGMAYVLYLAQNRCFEIWEHFGGRVRNGMPVLALCWLVSKNLLHPEKWPPVLSVMVQ